MRVFKYLLQYIHKLLTSKRVFDLRDVGKMRRVGNTQTPHAVSVTPLSEVTLERLRSLVSVVPANLARIADVQAVELVEPVGDGLFTDINK